MRSSFWFLAGVKQIIKLHQKNMANMEKLGTCRKNAEKALESLVASSSRTAVPQIAKSLILNLYCFRPAIDKHFFHIFIWYAGPEAEKNEEIMEKSCTTHQNPTCLIQLKTFVRCFPWSCMCYRPTVAKLIEALTSSQGHKVPQNLNTLACVCH